MSNSSVRDAFEQSVTARPVNLNVSQASIVPIRSVAAARAIAEAVDVVEQPLDLRAREVGIDHEPRALADELLVALALELIAARGRAAVLPDDGVVERLAAALVPGDDGLALVGDADRP